MGKKKCIIPKRNLLPKHTIQKRKQIKHFPKKIKSLLLKKVSSKKKLIPNEPIKSRLWRSADKDNKLEEGYYRSLIKNKAKSRVMELVDNNKREEQSIVTASTIESATVTRNTKKTKLIKRGKWKNNIISQKKPVNYSNRFVSQGILACTSDMRPLISVGQNRLFYIASIVKLFVLCTFWELNKKLKLNLQSLYEVPEIKLPRNQTKIGLKKKDKISLDDLIYSMVIHSGNDASEALAMIVGNKIKTLQKGKNNKNEKPGGQIFIQKIHQFCRDHNLNSTLIMGVRGIEYSHSSTADVVRLLKHIYENSQLFKYFKVTQRAVSIVGENNKARMFCLQPTNLLFQSHFYGKTGSHPERSFNFASVKEYRGVPIFMAALGSASETGRFTDSQLLFSMASRLVPTVNKEPNIFLVPQTKTKSVTKLKHLQLKPGIARRVTRRSPLA